MVKIRLLKIMLGLILVLVLASVAHAQNATKLEIDKVTLWINGDKKSISDGSSKDVEPGDDLKIKIEVENLYEDRDDEIEDIEIELIGSELDEDEDDWEDDGDIDDIKGSKTDDVTFTFTLPYELNTGDQTVTLTVTGDCPNSTDVCDDEIEFELQVDKDKHKLLFTKSSVDPAAVECSGAAILNLQIFNVGEEDEDDTEISAKNEALGLDFMDTQDITECVDDDCKYSKSVTIDVAEGTPAGSYPIALKATYDEGDETITETVNLVVNECEVEVEEEPEEDEEDVDVEVEEPEEDEEEEPVVIAPEAPDTEVVAKKYTTNEIILISVIVLAEIIAVLIGVFLIVKLVKK